jgi:Phosphatidylinositol-specific phospholipase C, X domain/Phosphatidylinositol-specific phospholipase C, Y domain
VTFAQFERLYRNLRFRPEIAEIFVSRCKVNQSYMLLSEFCSFLSDSQKCNWSEEKCLSIFTKFTPIDAPGMDIDHFTAFLMSSKNHAIGKNITDDLNFPLHHYYVNSSHNTYLLSDQLIGDSSVEGYIRALQRGCRCVELDCWDGPENTPIIYHGRTLTSKILFKDAVEAIKKYAFVASISPLILSLEIHCSPAQQDIMAEVLVKVFGDMLLSTPIESDADSIPSPKMLEGLVLLKGKLVMGEVEAESDEDHSPRSFLMNNVGLRISRAQSPVTEPKKREFSQCLSDLIVYFKGQPWKSIEVNQFNPQTLKFNQIISITDRKATVMLNLIKDISKFNVVRVYPSIIRVNSSNFDPLPFWFAGIQMVALNFQTNDRPMELNQAFFDGNGKYGYILKPRCFFGGPAGELVTVNLRIISAQQIQTPTFVENFRAEVCVDIVSYGQEPCRFRTAPVKTNGFNCIWDHTIEISTPYPELTFLKYSFKLI